MISKAQWRNLLSFIIFGKYTDQGGELVIMNEEDDSSVLCRNKNHLIVKIFLILAGMSVLLARKWLDDDVEDIRKW